MPALNYRNQSISAKSQGYRLALTAIVAGLVLQSHTVSAQQATTPPPVGSPATGVSEIPRTVTKAADVLVSPSMKETEIRLRTELPAFGSDYVVTKIGSTILGDKYSIEDAGMSDCRLTVRLVQQQGNLVNGKLNVLNRKHTTYIISFKDVDKVLPEEIPTGGITTKSKPSYWLRFVAVPDRGEPFQQETEGFGDAKSTKSVHIATVRGGDEDMANRLAVTLRHAAAICGAPQQSPATPPVDASPTPSVASTPTSTATSKITNADIIAMVTAGLSDEVVITSISQARSKDFDLTPAGLIALKKARVADAIIAAMQKNVTPVNAAVTSETKGPSKYDPSLASPSKAAAAQLPNACTGIENMGLYKNEIFDRAVGGGVVEWLAKIRNNTGVTKIVIFGWRDMYGQQQKAQVQIRGGEIASPRLDLTQARVIPPVTDLRLLSCE